MVISQNYCERIVQLALDDFSSDVLVPCSDGIDRTASEVMFCLCESVRQGHADDLPCLLRIARCAEDSEVMLQVGELYLYGQGVESSAEEAYAWFLRASHAGSAEAMARVGWMLLVGIGVAKNVRLAVDWLLLAAEEGYRPAQDFLIKVTSRALANAAAQLPSP
ncbi:MAG: tetratricopeptide repeat protein [bacterium]|nr:tetratricopeptide repeat protein [bacterium]